MTFYLKDECLNHVRGGDVGPFSSPQAAEIFNTLSTKGPEVSYQGNIVGTLPQSVFYIVGTEVGAGSPESISPLISNLEIVK